MAERQITISATKANPEPLIITDELSHETASTKTNDALLTTLVQPHDIVRWIPAGDISSIDAIEIEPLSINLFSKSPFSTDKGTWAGTISPKATDGLIESYRITYTVNGRKYSQDPKIRIDPKK